MPSNASDNALRKLAALRATPDPAPAGRSPSYSGAFKPASGSHQKPIVFHDFHYPECAFRVSLFAGRLLPQPASMLVNQAYSRLGYVQREANHPATTEAEAAAVLHAVHDDHTLGTLSVNFDSSAGLNADALYRRQIDDFRAQGKSCEFTRLALDTEQAGREVLCSLFYMAYVFSHIVHGARHLFIEVNPRHQCFYERMLGFHRLGEEKLCQRVNAPAVLLHLDFQFTREQVQRFRQGRTVAGTTLYRYAVPSSEERLLVHRMNAGFQ